MLSCERAGLGVLLLPLDSFDPLLTLPRLDLGVAAFGVDV